MAPHITLLFSSQMKCYSLQRDFSFQTKEIMYWAPILIYFLIPDGSLRFHYSACFLFNILWFSVRKWYRQDEAAEMPLLSASHYLVIFSPPSHTISSLEALSACLDYCHAEFPSSMARHKETLASCVQLQHFTNDCLPHILLLRILKAPHKISECLFLYFLKIPEGAHGQMTCRIPPLTSCCLKDTCSCHTSWKQTEGQSI